MTGHESNGIECSISEADDDDSGVRGIAISETPTVPARHPGHESAMQYTPSQPSACFLRSPMIVTTGSASASLCSRRNRRCQSSQDPYKTLIRFPPSVLTGHSEAMPTMGGVSQGAGYNRLLSRRMLFSYLQHLFNCLYLMLIVAVGFMFQLINALTYVDRGKSHNNKHDIVSEQYKIFLMIMHAMAVILLAWITICLTMRKCDEDKEHGEGLNFFLRVGSIVFCIGAIILYILQSLAPLELLLVHECQGEVVPVEIASYLVTVLFYSLQTYFLFKYHKTAFICGTMHCEKRYVVHAYLIRFAMMHLIGVNILQWLHSIIWEAMELFYEAESHYNKTVTTVSGSHHHNKTECSQTVKRKLAAKTAQPYLFPCIIEYSLIAASALLAMYLRVGRREWNRIHDKVTSTAQSSPAAVHHEDNQAVEMVLELSGDTGDGGPEEEIVEPNSYADVTFSYPPQCSNAAASLYHHCHRPGICEKSHVGFFLGLMIFAIFIVYIACEFIFEAKLQTHFVLRVTFSCLWILVYFMGSVMVVYLAIRLTIKFRFDFLIRVQMEKLLLYVTYFGNLSFIIICILADVDNLVTATYHTPEVQTLNIVVNAFQLLQETLQSGFVLYGLNLRAISKQQRRQKCGRTCLTLLIFINMVVWLHESLLLKQFILGEQYVNFYGLPAWCMLASTCYPLIIFFRFHSASLVAEMWSRAYE